MILDTATQPRALWPSGPRLYTNKERPAHSLSDWVPPSRCPSSWARSLLHQPPAVCRLVCGRGGPARSDAHHGCALDCCAWPRATPAKLVVWFWSADRPRSYITLLSHELHTRTHQLGTRASELGDRSTERESISNHESTPEQDSRASEPRREQYRCSASEPAGLPPPHFRWLAAGNGCGWPQCTVVTSSSGRPPSR